MRVLLLAARKYSFNDEKSGRLVEGCSLTYLTGDLESSPNRVGQVPLTIAAPLSAWSGIGQCPGWYDVDFHQRPGAGGKPTLQATGLTYLESISFDAAAVPDGVPVTA